MGHAPQTQEPTRQPPRPEPKTSKNKDPEDVFILPEIINTPVDLSPYPDQNQENDEKQDDYSVLENTTPNSTTDCSKNSEEPTVVLGRQRGPLNVSLMWEPEQSA